MEKNKDLFFSETSFKDLNLSENLIKALESKNYLKATKIQEKCIPLAMKGIDLMGTAKTGSGKSLAFLIPAVEMLIRTDFNQSQGTGVIVLTPTRELALQLYEEAKELFNFKKKTCGVIIGGNYRKKEAKKLKKGINLLIATPGRLLDHLKNSDGFNCDNLCMLIIDEADAILQNGFEDELKEILERIPKERQTLLFSATLNKKVENLISLSLKDPVFIKIEDQTPTVSNLEQGYVLIQEDKKFQFLYTFLSKHKNKKIMIFFATCTEVQFFSNLLNYVDTSVKSIHGDLKQVLRNSIFYEFINSDSGVLLCTDIAQRGLDFPDVDWIVQYDTPRDPQEYLHRVGRTARGAIAKGRAILLLLEHEKQFLNYLKSLKINLKEYEFSEDKLNNIQIKYEKLISSNAGLSQLAENAYKTYIFVNKLFNFSHI